MLISNLHFLDHFAIMFSWYYFAEFLSNKTRSSYVKRRPIKSFFKFDRRHNVTEILTVLSLPVFDKLFFETVLP